MPAGIVIFEGADGTGKTTLARGLHAACADVATGLGTRYLHLGVHRRIWTWHLAAARLALRWSAAGDLVLVDRLWLSEQVYGQVFRGGPAYDRPHAPFLDHVLTAAGAVTVLCVRGNLRRHLADFERLRAERPERFDRVREVAGLYADLALGQVAHPGQTYLDEWIRFGDFARRPDVLLYDMDLYAGPNGRYRFMDLILATLERRRATIEETRDHRRREPSHGP